MIIRWLKKLYLKRKIRKEWRRQMGLLTEEERMEIFGSKEQWANLLTVAASLIGSLNAQDIAAFFSKTAEGISTGSLEVVLTCAVTGIIGVSRFLSRLNRRAEIKQAALEAVRERGE